MADEIIDIEKWKTNYDFLKEFWTLYNKFDGDVESDPKNDRYDLLCDQYIRSVSENVTKHKNFCKKLIRNLGHYSDNPLSNIFTKKIINNIFEHYYEMFTSTSTIRGCSYHSYDESYEDPMIAIILNIFNTYIDDVINALMDRALSTSLRGRKFVCDCVKIYKNMKYKYCSNNNPKDHKHQKTCDEFNTFKGIYTSFLFGQNSLIKDILSLDDMDNEYTNMCGKYDETMVKAMVPVFSPSAGDNDDTTDETSSPKDVNVETRNNPISSTISTSLGAVAGASSVLALLYKFTPGRSWIRSGIGGNRRRISNNFYEVGPNELLFEGFEGRDMSSYNPTYNVGYGSV